MSDNFRRHFFQKKIKFSVKKQCVDVFFEFLKIFKILKTLHNDFKILKVLLIITIINHLLFISRFKNESG